MTLSAGRILMPFVVLGGLVAAGPAAALAPDIRDEAGFFKPETVAKARHSLEDIRHDYNTTVVVETIRTYPAENARKSKIFGTRPPVDQFFTQWAEERARAAGAADIFVFVCREPLRVRVVVKPATQAELFPDKARAKLRKALERSFEHKQYDRGLLDSLAFVGETLDISVHPEAHAPYDWPPILGVIAGILAVWVILGLVRSRVATLSPEDGAAADVPSLLGGMFGASAGHWLWETLGSRSEPVAAEDPVGDEEETLVAGAYAHTADGSGVEVRRGNEEKIGADFGDS